MYFTYLLKWTPYQKFYYGVRYKDTATLESVGTSYFSSSKYVKKFIEENGKPDVIEIRRVFKDKISAKTWEEKVIRRLKAIENPVWLNMGNNNAFRGVTCNADVRQSISKSRTGQSFGVMYNNGVINKFFKPADIVPQGWVKGKILSEKNINHIKKLNSEILTKEKRQIAGEKTSVKLKGVKKPPSHGLNVSKATKGVPKPWNQGDNNVSKRADVRKKISDSWKTRIIGKWFTDDIVNIYIKPGQIVPEGFRRGKTKTKK